MIMDNGVGYRQLIDEATVVSFDVFDTLIHRLVLNPVDVFAILVRRLKATEIGLYHPSVVANFAVLRQEAEGLARERHHLANGSYEVTFKDIYSLLKETAAIDETLLAQIMEEEFLIEQAVVYANPLMLSLFEYALQQQKTIVLCSDMYLSSEQISLLLRCAGYSPPFTLFVSGEIKQSKHDGSMFPLVCGQFGITPAQLAHFGDNYRADYQMPLALGVRTRLFAAFGQDIMPTSVLSPEKPLRDNGVYGLIQGTVRNVLLNQKAEDDPWFGVGASIFGPLFLGKFLWLIVNLRQEPVDKVLFFARDGYFFHQLYERYKALLEIDTPAEYVYLSRAVLFVPSFTEFETRRVWNLFSGRLARSVREHLENLDINPALVQREIKEAGFLSDEDIAPGYDGRMYQLLLRLYPLVMDTAKRRRGAVGEYVWQVVGDKRRIAMVDIGWGGNMQGSFSRLLQLRNHDVEIFGYYFGLFKNVAFNYLPRNQFRSYLVNESEPAHYAEAFQAGGIELLEFALMAPHGTTLGYEQNDGQIQPILEQNPMDEKVQAYAARVQQGALKFIEAIMPLVLHIGPEHLSSAEWAEPFFRLVNQPTVDEALLLGSLTHSDSATDTRRRLPLAQKLSAEITRQKGEAYKQAYADAYWKKAFELLNP